MSWVLSLSILLSICRVYIYVRLNIYYVELPVILYLLCIVWYQVLRSISQKKNKLTAELGCFTHAVTSSCHKLWDDRYNTRFKSLIFYPLHSRVGKTLGALSITHVWMLFRFWKWWLLEGLVVLITVYLGGGHPERAEGFLQTCLPIRVACARCCCAIVAVEARETGT